MAKKKTKITEIKSVDVNLFDIVKKEYKDYQIYSLLDRAIPYLQDGLKPGQRRILYTLLKHKSKGLTKVSSITGLVLTLHPHGPQSVETAITNLAQNFTFSNNYPLLDKKGAFGERMEPKPAAPRYIEAKLNNVMSYILFDDIKQVKFVPNYDEKETEPVCLLPKLPIMLLNGVEGIGTGFSTMIPSFHHSDIIERMKECIDNKSMKKLKPWFDNYFQKIEIEKESGKLIFKSKLEKIDGKIYITELPKGFDGVKIKQELGKLLEEGKESRLSPKKNFIDYIDESVDDRIRIQLVFKRGYRPEIKDLESTFTFKKTLSPNYTLIDDDGVVIFKTPEEILEIFTAKRLEVVKERYRLLIEELEKNISLDNEIIKFIKTKQYEKATKLKNRQEFVAHLKKGKYKFAEYLADMAIHRMTKEEVAKRSLLIKDNSKTLKEYNKIYKSKALIKKKLVEELDDLNEKLTAFLKKKNTEKLKQIKNSN